MNALLPELSLEEIEGITSLNEATELLDTLTREILKIQETLSNDQSKTLDAGLAYDPCAGWRNYARKRMKRKQWSRHLLQGHIGKLNKQARKGVSNAMIFLHIAKEILPPEQIDAVWAEAHKRSLINPNPMETVA